MRCATNASLISYTKNIYNEGIQQIADIPEILDRIIDTYGKSKVNQMAIISQLLISRSRGKSIFV